MKRYLPFLIVGFVAIATVVGGAVLYRANRSPQLPADKTALTSEQEGTVHVRGNPKAPVTLEEYGDYECPPCGNLAEPLKSIEHEYGNRLRMVFHHLPLVVHAHAKEAACAAEAAGQQGKFWEMHDLLYKEQPIWSKAKDVYTLFAAYAAMIGLDVERFKKDMESDQIKTRVAADQRDAAKIGVTSTPTIFVNNRAVSLATPDPVKVLREAIETALKPKPDKE
jgi:protein-disulfide isomerase